MLPSRVRRVVCSSLELAKTRPLSKMPSHVIVRALSNDKMKNNSFSGLVFLRCPPWSVLFLEAILVSVVCDASPDHDKA